MTPAGNEAVPAPAPEALLSVIKGDPTPEELAAVTAVVLSLAQSAGTGPETPGARHWARRHQLRQAPAPGPGAWRRSLG